MLSFKYSPVMPNIVSAWPPKTIATIVPILKYQVQLYISYKTRVHQTDIRIYTSNLNISCSIDCPILHKIMEEVYNVYLINKYAYDTHKWMLECKAKYIFEDTCIKDLTNVNCS